MKAARGAEIGVTSLNLAVFEEESDEKILERVKQCTDQRLFAIFQALKRGIMTVDEVHKATMIDEWFLNKLMNLVDMEDMFTMIKEGAELSETGKAELTQEIYLQAKKLGYPDKVIESMTGYKIENSQGVKTAI